MSKKHQKKLEEKYQFKTNYIKDISNFKNEILTKKIIPHQVEFQAPPRGKKICWLECPYCYGLSAEDNGERLEKERGIEILRQILDGGVKKIIFAGYATDPLNCSYISDLLELTIKKNSLFGFNTKALRIEDRFFEILKTNNLTDGAEGKFIITSLNSGSVALPDFSGTATQVGGMQIGSSFKIGSTEPVFQFNIIQAGSGKTNQRFYPGRVCVA